MKFLYVGDQILINFEDGDTDTEKRLVEQGIAFLRNLLVRLKEVKE